MRSHVLFVLPGIIASALLVGCMHARIPSGSSTAEFRTMSVLATDYRFEAPETIPAGNILVRLRNEGHEAHHMQLVKLETGKTPGELIGTLDGSVTHVPEWAQQMGGPNAAESGHQVEALVHLDPGHYALICLVPAKDGTVHAVLGMHKALEVVGNPSAETALDMPSDYHVAMADFDFTVLETITTGLHTFRVVNRGSEVHEASLVRLAPYASVEDVMASFAPGATDAFPGTLVGGITGLEPGREGVFMVALSPGRYGLFCLFPNPHHDTSHVRRGMAMTFTVE